MSFPMYPVYKNSGVEWLGSVPEHWAIFSLKRSVDGCTNGLWGDEPDGENDLAVIRVADFDRATCRVGLDKLTYRSIKQKERASRLLQSGDLLIEKSGGGEKTLVGCVVLFEHDFEAITSNFVARMRPLHEFDSGFLCYSFDSLYQGKVNFPAIKQTTGIQNLDSESYLQERFCFPSLPEQTQIARFLDHETARIDALIEEQQRLIELLKEKRRGIVLSALSDTSLPLVRIGHAVDVISRPVKQREDESYTPIGLFNRDRGLFHKEPREMQDMGDSDFFWIKSGDLIISGQFAWEGAVAMAGESEEGLVVSHRYPVLRGKHGVANTEYLYAILTTKHGDFLLNESSRGAAGRNRPLNLAALLKEKIRIPSKEIQEQVSNLVQNEAKVLTECRQQISLLQERRSALISAAVTGKIDVRGWQPAAHSQAPESAVAEAH